MVKRLDRVLVVARLHPSIRRAQDGRFSLLKLLPHFLIVDTTMYQTWRLVLVSRLRKTSFLIQSSSITFLEVA